MTKFVFFLNKMAKFYKNFYLTILLISPAVF